jgi:hypothetical protein
MALLNEKYLLITKQICKSLISRSNIVFLVSLSWRIRFRYFKYIFITISVIVEFWVELYKKTDASK